MIVVPLASSAASSPRSTAARRIDRFISVAGLSLSTVPEFVSGIVLIVVFAIGLKWLPVTRERARRRLRSLTQLRYLILPAIPLVLILFGYIARMARAGTIEALDSDYVRTATLKGLPRPVVIRRHVLRNSLLPTITVIATQTGYLIGGLVVVETLFNYPGLGRLIFTAATDKDFPMLEAGVLVIGVVYLVATLIADILYTVLNPRIRLQEAELWPTTSQVMPSSQPLGGEPVELDGAARPRAPRWTIRVAAAAGPPRATVDVSSRAHPPRAPTPADRLAAVPHRRVDPAASGWSVRDLRQGASPPITRSAGTSPSSTRHRRPPTGSAPTHSAATCCRV